MNRRQKIIVSITGIFLVLLILVGLTYAYFLTRIQGNTNEKSISVTTANLLVVYADGDPDVIETENITPGKEVGTKKFTVTNNGDAETDYVVVIDNVHITNKSNSTPATFESNDFVYTLTCESNQSEKTCDGVKDETMFPITNDGILIGNTIDVSEVQTYNLTVKYKETGKDQSNDMGKKLEARVNIKNFKELNPYSNSTRSLAYQIINTAATTKTGTPLKMTPETKPLEQISGEDEKELSVTSDDYGTSYYYRGNVEDNYVEFAGMCWRIVRIQGDGSVKLILAAERTCDTGNLNSNSGYATNGEKGIVGDVINTNYGSKYVNVEINDYIGDTDAARGELNEWLGRKISEDNDLNKLKEENWCIGDLKNAYEWSGTSGNIVGSLNEHLVYSEYIKYAAYIRYAEKSPKIRCETTGTEGEIDENKIGMLTMDEVAFAGGGTWGKSNTNYYLNQNATTNDWWGLSPMDVEDDYFWCVEASTVDMTGYITSKCAAGDPDPILVRSGSAVRPAVSLIPDVQISSGNGTLESPYTIE